MAALLNSGHDVQNVVDRDTTTSPSPSMSRSTELHVGSKQRARSRGENFDSVTCSGARGLTVGPTSRLERVRVGPHASSMASPVPSVHSVWSGRIRDSRVRRLCGRISCDWFVARNPAKRPSRGCARPR
jgi:hypothetical protein